MTMYSMNGIDLTGSQYRELSRLVSQETDEERLALSRKALQPYDDPSLWNRYGVDCYKALRSHRLIGGTPGMGVFLYDGTVTQAGIDFVQDIAASEANERRRTEEQRRHDYRVATYGTVAGGVLGLFSGALGAWLFSRFLELLQWLGL